MTITTKAEQVKTRAEFLEFIHALQAENRRVEAPWENADLSSYLEGLAGFASDMDGYFANKGSGVDAEIATWSLFAQMLVAAIMYE